MLFNTLANLRALIGTDPERAVAMLDRLNDFLRATLKASRSEATSGRHTLSDEFARLRDYLELMAVRMGPRLRYTLELPETLSHQSVPPLLLQPLVENAVMHGVEPSAHGAQIKISTQRRGSTVVIKVSNSTPAGVGTRGHGLALANVRERLVLMHDVQSRFKTVFKDGVFHVRLEVPV
jgi:two-component system sensor histidine kinase AlgZ